MTNKIPEQADYEHSSENEKMQEVKYLQIKKL